MVIGMAIVGLHTPTASPQSHGFQCHCDVVSNSIQSSRILWFLEFLGLFKDPPPSGDEIWGPRGPPFSLMIFAAISLHGKFGDFPSGPAMYE